VLGSVDMAAPRVSLGIGACLLVCCGKGTVPFVPPPPPPIGFQVHMNPRVIMPGEELEACTYFNLDLPDELAALNEPQEVESLTANGVDATAPAVAVKKIEVKDAVGLHHIQILQLANDVEDRQNVSIFDCAVDLFGGPLTGKVEPLFFTSRNDYSVEYEPGVARLLKRVPYMKDVAAMTSSTSSTSSVAQHQVRTRGAQLLYNFHYINASDQPITAETVVNLYTVDPSTVVHPVRSAWWNYIYFNDKSQLASTIDAHGSFLVDVNLVGVTSHQHKTGTDFTYTRADGTQIYKNPNWAEPFYQAFPPGTKVPTGEQINFRCQWFNPFIGDRFFGLEADDEMCTAILEYYALDEAAADALLAMQQMNTMGHIRGNPFGAELVSLEKFYPIPDDVIQKIMMDPQHATMYVDHDIICGIAYNVKKLEIKYGKPADVLHSLELLLVYLGPMCGL
jgi:hypothetical protein